MSRGTLRPEQAAGSTFNAGPHLAYDDGRRPRSRGQPGSNPPAAAPLWSAAAAQVNPRWSSCCWIRPAGPGEIIVNGVSLGAIRAGGGSGRSVGSAGPGHFLRYHPRQPVDGAAGCRRRRSCRRGSRAGCWIFADRLPRGLDTPVGEAGGGTFPGEAQRVALGGCFSRNAPVLLLDEPCAGLDAETERRCSPPLNPCRRSDGSEVTHRLADIHRADRIVLLEQGRSSRPAAPQNSWRPAGRSRGWQAYIREALSVKTGALKDLRRF